MMMMDVIIVCRYCAWKQLDSGGSDGAEAGRRGGIRRDGGGLWLGHWLREVLRFADHHLVGLGSHEVEDRDGVSMEIDIKCRYSGLKPNCAVLVATARALKMHGTQLSALSSSW